MADSPLHYWRNGEASGIAMVDEVAVDGSYIGAISLGNAPIYVGGPTSVTTFADGRYGTSAVVSPAITAMTLISVVNFNTISGIQPVGVSRHVSGGDKFQWRSNGGAMEFVKIVGGVVVVTQASVFSPNTTCIAGFTVDSSGNYVMYKDGAAVKSGTIAPADYGSPGAAAWQLGYPTGMGAALDGFTCENVVFDKVISPVRMAEYATAVGL
jgi:hypothetical protein